MKMGWNCWGGHTAQKLSKCWSKVEHLFDITIYKVNSTRKMRGVWEGEWESDEGSDIIKADHNKLKWDIDQWSHFDVDFAYWSHMITPSLLSLYPIPLCYNNECNQSRGPEPSCQCKVKGGILTIVGRITTTMMRDCENGHFVGTLVREKIFFSSTLFWVFYPSINVPWAKTQSLQLIDLGLGVEDVVKGKAIVGRR